MKKILFLAIGIIVVGFIVTYGIYYAMIQNMTWKFIGLNFSGASEESEAEKPTGLPSISGLLDSTKVNLQIGNTSTINFKVKNLNLKVLDGNGNVVGSIETVKQISIPKKGETDLPLSLKNVRVATITKDFLMNGLGNYRYRVSGLLAGFVPFSYKGKIIY